MITTNNFADTTVAKQINIGEVSIFMVKNVFVGFEYFGAKRCTGSWELIDDYLKHAGFTQGSHEEYRGWYTLRNRLTRCLPGESMASLPRILRYAGASPKAFGLTLGSHSLYFSYDKLMAVKTNNILYFTAEKFGGATPKHFEKLPSADANTRVSTDDVQAIAKKALFQYFVPSKIKWDSLSPTELT